MKRLVCLVVMLFICFSIFPFDLSAALQPFYSSSSTGINEIKKWDIIGFLGIIVMALGGLVMSQSVGDATDDGTGGIVIAAIGLGITIYGYSQSEYARLETYGRVR